MEYNIFLKSKFPCVMHRASTLLILLLAFSTGVQAKEYAYQTGEFSPESSFFHVLIYSTGWLGVFGHDHVVAARSWESHYGISEDGDFEITMKIDVASLEIDNAKDRAAYSQFSDSEQPSVEAIDGTKANMLSEAVLDVANYPNIRVVIKGNLENRQTRINLKVKDHEAALESDYVLECDDGLAQAKGEFSLKHADLGLEPYSAFFGSIEVAESIDFKYMAVLASDCDMLFLVNEPDLVDDVGF